MSKQRVPRQLNEDEVRRLTMLEPDEIDKNLMIKYFANFEDEEAIFIPQDYFVLRKDILNKYAKENKFNQDIQTTIGRYIVNLFLIMYNDKFLKKVGYLNEPLDDGKIGDLSNSLSSMLLINEISIEEYYDYINRLNWFGFANSAFTTPSINYDILKPLPKVMKRKEELLKQHEEAITNNDPTVSVEIEQELIKLAKEELKDNPARDLYDSGAKVNWGNQYKNMNIMCGALKDNTSGGYRIITNSFIEGMEKEDVAANGDSLVSGVYSRAVGGIHPFMWSKHNNYKRKINHRKYNECQPKSNLIAG